MKSFVVSILALAVTGTISACGGDANNNPAAPAATGTAGAAGAGAAGAGSAGEGSAGAPAGCTPTPGDYTGLNCCNEAQEKPANLAQEIPDTACETCMDNVEAQGQTKDEQATCACNHCAAFLAGCFDSAGFEEGGGDADRDTKCKAVVQCARESKCADTKCYLGEGGIAAPNGPCMAAIETAAGVAADMEVGAKVVELQKQQADTATALGRAFLLSGCVAGTEAAPGKCATVGAP